MSAAVSMAVAVSVAAAVAAAVAVSVSLAVSVAAAVSAAAAVGAEPLPLLPSLRAQVRAWIEVQKRKGHRPSSFGRSWQVRVRACVSYI